MNVLALTGAVVVGLLLGLLGSGGSILTFPLLHYVLGQPTHTAVATSLLVVGGMSLIGAIPHAFRGYVPWRTVACFGLPGIVGAWCGAALAQHVDTQLQLAAFCMVMLAAALRMLNHRDIERLRTLPTPGNRYVAVTGAGVGALTGLVGVGGGFLIVPALVLLLRLPIRQAIGASLMIIALNATGGYLKYATQVPIDPCVVALFVLMGSIGTLTGAWAGAHLPHAVLRRGFGVLLIVITFAIVRREWL